MASTSTSGGQSPVKKAAAAQQPSGSSNANDTKATPKEARKDAAAMEATSHSNTAATQPGGHPPVTSLPGQGTLPPPANSGDSGPGTGVQGPAEVESAGPRTPARMVDVGAAPIEAPDTLAQVAPRLGYEESSTNQIAAAAATRSMPGERHVRLVGEDGKAVSTKGLFKKPEGPGTVVTVTKRVYEEFKYPGSERTTSRLVYPEGAQVDALTAARFEAAHKAQNA